MMNFHLGIAFKIAGEWDTKQGEQWNYDFYDNCSSQGEKVILLS